LDWQRGNAHLLGLSIGRDRINLAVASHPSTLAVDGAPFPPDGEEAHPLPPVPVRVEVRDGRRVLSRSVAEELASIERDWNVCGLVVGWPVQKQGWCGAACGRVLFTLDQLASEGVLKELCLWEDHERQELRRNQHQCDDSPFEDHWGRSPIYVYRESSNVDGKTVHLASKEQYYAEPTGTVAAADFLNDFCHANWPELYSELEADWGGRRDEADAAAGSKPKQSQVLPPPSAGRAFPPSSASSPDWLQFDADLRLAATGTAL